MLSSSSYLFYQKDLYFYGPTYHEHFRVQLIFNLAIQLTLTILIGSYTDWRFNLDILNESLISVGVGGALTYLMPV